jgi:hypothetical protein
VTQEQICLNDLSRHLDFSMKYNPIKKELYSDKGEFIKKLACPFLMNWSELQPIKVGVRNCNQCNRAIIDTAILEDDALLEIVRTNPNTCLKVDLNQNNLTVN